MQFVKFKKLLPILLLVTKFNETVALNILIMSVVLAICFCAVTVINNKLLIIFFSFYIRK